MHVLLYRQQNLLIRIEMFPDLSECTSRGQLRTKSTSRGQLGIKSTNRGQRRTKSTSHGQLGTKSTNRGQLIIIIIQYL